MRLFESQVEHVSTRQEEGGDNVYYDRFPRSRWHLCAFEQGTLKYIDYNFAHQCVPIMPEGADRSKISLKKLAVREVMRHLALSKLGSRYCLSAFEPV